MKLTKYLRKCKLLFYLSLLVSIALTGCVQKESNISLPDNQNIDIASFFNLQKSIIKNDLNIEKINDYNDISLNVDGKFDLNLDGKLDSIEIKLLGPKESSIRINKSEVPLDCDHPYDFYLVDLIENDDFIELAIYDDGPSGDPKTFFYRYDGKEIYELGSFNTAINVEDSAYAYYGNVLTDGKGSFISPGDIVKFVSPTIIKGYHSIEKNEFVYNPVDYSKYLDIEYTLTMDLKAFFIEQNVSKDLVGQDIGFIWDEEEITEFKKGKKIKLIIMDDFWYGVELEDGTTGILYFWIGD